MLQCLNAQSKSVLPRAWQTLFCKCAFASNKASFVRPISYSENKILCPPPSHLALWSFTPVLHISNESCTGNLRDGGVLVENLGWRHVRSPGTCVVNFHRGAWPSDILEIIAALLPVWVQTDKVKMMLGQCAFLGAVDNSCSCGRL